MDEPNNIVPIQVTSALDNPVDKYVQSMDLGGEYPIN
jgi:hypothetical protein